MLDVGIIGLGPAWETRYRPALHALRSRLRVRAVHDQVSNRAHFVAEEFGAQVSLGVAALIARPDVQAILLLDSGWYGHVPLHFACTTGKPVYIAGGLGDSLESLLLLQQKVAERGIDFMPEFSRRYAPTTGRLQELMATRLGRPREIRVQAVLPGSGRLPIVPGQTTELDFLIGLVDWCRYLVGTPPREIHTLQDPLPGTFRLSENAPRNLRPERQIILEFQMSQSDGHPARASLELLSPGTLGAAASEICGRSGLRCEVICARGRAEVHDGVTLAWGAEGTLACESLTSDRPEVEVMLDHFCRRVVGGLVPIPSLDDVRHCFNIVEAVRRSQREGRPVAM